MIPRWLIIWYIPLFITFLYMHERKSSSQYDQYMHYILCIIYCAAPSEKFYYKAESLKNILWHTPSWSRLYILQSTVLYNETKLWYTYPVIVPSNQLAGCNHHDAVPPPVTSSNGFISSKLCTKPAIRIKLLRLKAKTTNRQ